MKRKRKTLKALGRGFLLVGICLVLGLRLYSWNARTFTGNALPMPFGFGMSVVLSGSMEPTLSVDDLVIIRAAKDYKVGDIVVYQDASSLVIHKVIAIDEDQIVTKGEANNTADDPIPVSAVKGKAIGHIPMVGAAVRFLRTPVGLVLLLVAAIVLFELPFLGKRKTDTQEQEQIKAEIRRLKGE